jgi:spore germination protein YaaH
MRGMGKNNITKVAAFFRRYVDGYEQIAVEFENSLDGIKECLNDFVKRYRCKVLFSVSYEKNHFKTVIAVPIESGLGDPVDYLDMELNSAQNRRRRG